MTFEQYLQHQIAQVDSALQRWIPAETVLPSTIHRAMRYSIFAGGKRIRPVLCMAAAEAIRPDVPDLADAACSLEMVHTYSLIHDDLPALDNDDLRRGRPTNHIVFGEAMAILAGDSLLTLAFQVLSHLPNASAEIRLHLLQELSVACGTVDALIGGQVEDIEGEGKPHNAQLLERIHRGKTGALLRCSVRLGAILAGANAHQLRAATEYGEHVGLAFQIVDDLLDIEQSSEQLGKTAGKDLQQGKMTFPAVYGLETSRQMAADHHRQASEALNEFGERGHRLREIASLIVDRKQ